MSDSTILNDCYEVALDILGIAKRCEIGIQNVLQEAREINIMMTNWNPHAPR